MAVNFPQWMSVYPKIDKYKETQRYSYHSETANTKGKILKAMEEKVQILYKGIMITMTACFSTETVGPEDNRISSKHRENHSFQFSIVCPEKFCKNKNEIHLQVYKNRVYHQNTYIQGAFRVL